MNKNKTIWLVLGLLAIICFIVFKDYLLLKKAYFFYDICSDGFYSRYPLLYNLTDNIAKNGIPSWSFKIGMGQNIFPFLLNEPFDIILYIGGKNHIIQLVPYVEVAKIMATGIVFFQYLKTLNFSTYTCIAGTLLFSFCGFITEGSAWFGFTFEAFNFAVFLLAFELLYLKQKWGLFPFAIFLVCITMPFMLWVYTLFMAFYACLRLAQSGDLRISKVGVLYGKMILAALVGLLLAGPFLLQNAWMLLHTPRGADSGSLIHKIAEMHVLGVSDDLQLGSNILRFFSNDILGSGNNYRGWDTILGSGLFYCGLPCLLLLPQIFPFLNRKAAILFMLFLLLWLLPIVFPFFRWAFWLFTGDYYRNYSLFVAFLVLYYSLLAMDYILKIQKLNFWILLTSLALLLILLYHPFFINKNSIDHGIRTFVSIMLISYCALLLFMNRFKAFNYGKYIFIAIIFIEVCYSGWVTANRRDSFGMDWLLNGKVVYNDSFNDAVKEIQQNDKSFYRIDRNYFPASARYSNLNFSQKQGYNSTSSYNSFNQLYYVRYLQLMGIVDKNNEEETRYAIGLIGNPIEESESNVKYLLTTQNYHPVWPEIWDSLAKTGDVTIYRNNCVLPFAYSYDHYIKESNFNLASPLQKKFITLNAFVIKDEDIKQVTRLKEFQLSDTLTGTLDVNVFKNKLGELRKDTLALTKFDDTRFSGDVTLGEDKLVYFPVPYDDGWQLVVDVSEIRPLLVNGGMMGVVLEKGKHHLELFYKLRFMVKGALMTLAGILILVIGHWASIKRKIKAVRSRLSTKFAPL